MDHRLVYRAFLSVTLLFVLAAGLLLAFSEKGAGVIFFDRLHRPWLDALFIGLTNLGDGLWIGVFCLVLCFFRYKYAITLAFIGWLQLLLVGWLKQVVFSGMPRPLAYFEEGTLLNVVSGIRIHHMHSFPSGHTVTAFSLCFFLALIIGRRAWAYRLAALAVAIGLSRVYLAQHFLEDVLAAVPLGLGLAGIVYQAASSYPVFWESRRWNNSLLGRSNYPTKLA